MLDDQPHNILVSLTHGLSWRGFDMKIAICERGTRAVLLRWRRNARLSIVLGTAIRLHGSGRDSLLFTRWGWSSTVFWFWRRCQYCSASLYRENSPEKSSVWSWASEIRRVVSSNSHCSYQICFARWRHRMRIVGDLAKCLEVILRENQRHKKSVAYILSGIFIIRVQILY